MTDIARLKSLLGGIKTEDNPAIVKQKSRDFFWYSPVLKRQLDHVTGDLVVSPKSEAEVIEILKACFRHGVPVTPRGTGTGNYGQAMPLSRGVVLSLADMNAVKSVGRGRVTVEAGAVIANIDRETRKTGQELRMHPSTYATATIGGQTFSMHLDLGAQLSSLRPSLWDKATLTTEAVRTGMVDEVGVPLVERPPAEVVGDLGTEPTDDGPVGQGEEQVARRGVVALHLRGRDHREQPRLRGLEADRSDQGLLLRHHGDVLVRLLRPSAHQLRRRQALPETAACEHPPDPPGPVRGPLLGARVVVEPAGVREAVTVRQVAGPTTCGLDVGVDQCPDGREELPVRHGRRVG